MTRPFDRHLDSDELDALVSSQAIGVPSSGQLSEEATREAQRHVDSCQDCQRKVQMHKSVQSEIFRRLVPSSASPSQDCIEDSEWVRVAAGLLSERESRELMKHAAQCGHCGPLLRAAAETLSDDATQAEEALVASLSSARPEWQSRMVETLQSTGRPQRMGKQKTSVWRGPFLWPRPAYALATVALLVVAGWFGVRMLYPPSAEKLLAQAYTEHRTLEVRIPGAKYAPLRVERSVGASNLDKPESLLRAEFLISERLQKNPGDPVWLQAKARADLLDGNYESAIETLQRALEAQPDSPSLLIDLGSAYAVRSQSAARPIDDGKAVEFLTQALNKRPDDPIALFNRALVYEHLSLYTEAVGDWEHYLRVDPQTEWADDAWRRLAADKQKLEERKRSLSEPLLTPNDMAELPNDPSVGEKVDRRIEDYLRVAIADWAPLAFPEASRKPSFEARSALSLLAAITRDQHDDLWLTDLLREPTTGRFNLAVKALSDSLHSNERGDYVAERDSAHKAALLFRLAGNTAGELRAQAEEIYSDQLLFDGYRCLALLHSVAEPIRRYGYAWLKGQMSLEQSNCADAVGDLGTYRAAILTGLSVAERHKYPALQLRALGFEVLSDGSVGECGKAFLEASQGLSLFSAGRADLMKGYNLYFNLESVAEELHLPGLQVALLNEATALIDAHPNPLIRAMAHTWYGKAAYLANLPQLASAQFAQASELLKLSPQTAATQKDWMGAEIYRANAEIRHGDVEKAAERLNTIRPILEREPSFDPLIGFYSAQADIALLQSNSAVAESSLRSAIYIAESALHSYHSEGERREWAEQTRNAYAHVVEWKLRQHDGTAALEFWEWYRGADLRSNSNDLLTPPQTVPFSLNDAPPLPSPTIVTDRLSLLHDVTVVSFAAFADGVAVWTYDDRGVYWRWIPKPFPELQQLAFRFHHLCADPKSDLGTLRTSARSLYNLLVAPVEDRLVSGRTIMFEPDEVLAMIPWEALVDPSSRYLAERGPIIVSPGMYRVMHLRQATEVNADAPALIVSVPAAPEENLTPLADAEFEARSVAGAFHAARALYGADATLAAIRLGIRGASVFHFAGHAVASPQRSGLVLAEPDSSGSRSRLVDAGSLGSPETSSLRLAVLSACNSNGDTDLDSGTEPLAESLLRLGVPHVVASRWSVDSRATAELMKRFYADLLVGGDVAKAMHTARMALAAQPAWAHPYYWAAFELRGN